MCASRGESCSANTRYLTLAAAAAAVAAVVRGMQPPSLGAACSSGQGLQQNGPKYGRALDGCQVDPIGVGVEAQVVEGAIHGGRAAAVLWGKAHECDAVRWVVDAQCSPLANARRAVCWV